MAGFCSGLSFGLAGIGLMGVSAEVLSPRAPTAPLNVDVDAWSAGYRSKVKSKRLIKGIIGSVVGTALMVVVFSIAPTN